MLAVVHVDQQKTGDLMWAEVASLMQLLVPRNGHCLCAKLNLNETKKGVMLDAVWQKANGGRGEESIGSAAMSWCHVRDKAMIAHSKVWRLQPDARRWLFPRLKKGSLSREQTWAICRSSGQVFVWAQHRTARVYVHLLWPLTKSFLVSFLFQMCFLKFVSLEKFTVCCYNAFLHLRDQSQFSNSKMLF